jgi:biopolymer transport protein ExbB
LNGPVVLGGNGVNNLMSAFGASFSGEIDELEISKVARPADFIKLGVASQGGGDAAAKLLTMTDDVKPASWLASLKTGYIGVIVGSLSFDGWVVIGILMVMSVISWLVMVSKAGYLNRIGRGNVLFLEEWRQVATDLSVLEDGDTSKAKSMGLAPGSANYRIMHTAPLYRIYHIGVEELRHRTDKDKEAGSKKALSSRSIQAIRASLDGGLVRETQRLNDKMVLLTIAISGGPFLGLLGTVVGVMITFAAVAQAGDVNVNAIAPGIAAALLATVAGLAVAIPALFGYNYLLTRIKGATSNMHVFIDEFVTKLAEFYRE